MSTGFQPLFSFSRHPSQPPSAAFSTCFLRRWRSTFAPHRPTLLLASDGGTKAASASPSPISVQGVFHQCFSGTWSPLLFSSEGNFCFNLGQWFQMCLIFTLKFGEKFQFDDPIFQMGWFYHHVTCHIFL